MPYQVLARKWRPQRFEDMVGQEVILRMLTNALTQQRLHHAYLFTGTRGVGKTTLARILAKCFNCETGVTATPCGTCPTCQAIEGGQFMDLYEVDAASRTKVEDTRELLDNILYPPTQGRYKIYLIDEVHMLSNHSFNALLKTLEEPPAHVKFLLATTDPKRLPITILSRCLQFHLRRITPEQIAKHLQHICSTENISSEQPALEKLAKAADGSLRDALSLLDQAIAYGQGCITQEEVQTLLGCVAQEDLLPLLQALAQQKGNELFQALADLSERAPDFQSVLEELITLFHRLAIMQMVPTSTSGDDSLLALSQQFTPEDIQIYYQIALLGRRDLPLAPSPQQGFEMTVLRLLAFKPSAVSTEKTSSKPTVKPSPHPAPEIVNKVATHSSPAPAIVANTDWRDLLPKLELTGMAYALAANCTLVKLTEHNVELALSAHHEPMLNQKLKERIAEALSRHLDKTIQLDISLTAEELPTPAKLQQHEQKEQLAAAAKTIMQDPKVKQLVEMYDAAVEVSLIN